MIPDPSSLTLSIVQKCRLFSCVMYIFSYYANNCYMITLDASLMSEKFSKLFLSC